ncbi:unnamed protein product [Prunus armeniaca]
MDNLRTKLLISKQVIVNSGDEYLPSKFFSCLRLSFNLFQALEGFLNWQNCNLFSLNGTEVARLEDY